MIKKINFKNLPTIIWQCLLLLHYFLFFIPFWICKIIFRKNKIVIFTDRIYKKIPENAEKLYKLIQPEDKKFLSFMINSKLKKIIFDLFIFPFSQVFISSHIELSFSIFHEIYKKINFFGKKKLVYYIHGVERFFHEFDKNIDYIWVNSLREKEVFQDKRVNFVPSLMLQNHGNRVIDKPLVFIDYVHHHKNIRDVINYLGSYYSDDYYFLFHPNLNKFGNDFEFANNVKDNMKLKDYFNAENKIIFNDTSIVFNFISQDSSIYKMFDCIKTQKVMGKNSKKVPIWPELEEYPTWNKKTKHNIPKLKKEVLKIWDAKKYLEKINEIIK
ncbi:hypothetical protein MYMA111404_01475 [Mycoplasma marinum]|uniref:Uncharacterized protein n=1 Tax=Mycoplasma marinum TaxID=1937190 RepID=A0A4R0XWW8_9MOLU|nr:hypothetical protein [Mycoplasma marinum]TCG11491.1 hypothetical protein C4B24_01905 [Mycoplasma marinum]